MCELRSMTLKNTIESNEAHKCSGAIMSDLAAIIAAAVGGEERN